MPSGVSLTFAGLRSRWTMPFAWASASASAICLAIARLSSTAIGPRFSLSARSSPVDEFHRDEVDRRHPRASPSRSRRAWAMLGVVERGEKLCLPLEAGEAIGVGGERLGQQLEGDVAAQLRVRGPEHLAHAAGAERSYDLVGAEAGSRSEAHRGGTFALSSSNQLRTTWISWGSRAGRGAGRAAGRRERRRTRRGSRCVPRRPGSRTACARRPRRASRRSTRAPPGSCRRDDRRAAFRPAPTSARARRRSRPRSRRRAWPLSEYRPRRARSRPRRRRWCGRPERTGRRPCWRARRERAPPCRRVPASTGPTTSPSRAHRTAACRRGLPTRAAEGPSARGGASPLHPPQALRRGPTRRCGSTRSRCGSRRGSRPDTRWCAGRPGSRACGSRGAAPRPTARHSARRRPACRRAKG